MEKLGRVLKLGYYCMIVSAFCANMIVVSHTTTLSVLGAGLALRGPDGSMMTATDGLYEERKSVFLIFGIGLGCTVGSVVICVWLLLHWESALVCMFVALLTCRTIWNNYRRVQGRFSYDESQTVDFRDIMEGPAAIQAVPWRFGGVNKSSSVTMQHEDDVTSMRQKDGFDLEWQQSKMNVLDKNDTVKRRGGKGYHHVPDSPPKESFIQTI